MTTIKKLPGLWKRARTTVLSLAGFAGLTAAAWTLALPAGLAAAGISCFALEYLTDSDGGKR